MKVSKKKLSKKRQGTNHRDGIMRVIRSVLKASWKNFISIQRQGNDYILRVKRMLTEKEITRVHNAMRSFAEHIGGQYNFKRRTLTVVQN